MCQPFDGNKVLVCRVGDLKPGNRFRTPEGTELMVLGIESKMDGATRVADIATGEVRSFDNGVKLGRDRAGRLYASRSLNNPKPAADEVPSNIQAFGYADEQDPLPAADETDGE